MTTVPARGPFSIAEWEALPDDGNRYELIGGVVYVNGVHLAAPLVRLLGVLEAARPADPLVRWGVTDLAGRGDALVYGSDGHQRLAVGLGRRAAARTCDACWILDADEPSLLVFEREGDRLVERAHVRGDEAYAATVPFAVTVVPSALVD